MSTFIWMSIEAGAAIYLIWMVAMIKTDGTAISALLFRFVPNLLGGGLSFLLVAKFMGWPI